MTIKEIRELIVRTAYTSKEGHIPSAFSILNILNVLYGRILNIDKDNPESTSRDRFVLSKGHASLGLYAILLANRLISNDEIKSFGSYNSNLGGHPDLRKVPFVEASTGSLGHGLPIALGLAKGAKILGISNKVYSIIGDGECNEGTIWESALLAKQHKLDNLCCIIDHNHSTDRALDVGNLFEKFVSFGWSALIVNGHDEEELLRAFRKFPTSDGKPFVIIAETTKGFGAKSIENQPSWHHKIPSTEELELLIKEIYEHE